MSGVIGVLLALVLPRVAGLPAVCSVHGIGSAVLVVLVVSSVLEIGSISLVVLALSVVHGTGPIVRVVLLVIRAHSVTDLPFASASALGLVEAPTEARPCNPRLRLRDANQLYRLWHSDDPTPKAESESRRRFLQQSLTLDLRGLRVRVPP